MELAEDKRKVGTKRRRVKPKQIEFQRMVAAIVNTQRLHCEFRLQAGKRFGKSCDKLAKETELRGVGTLKTRLCWRHRKLIAKQKNIGIVSVES